MRLTGVDLNLLVAFDVLMVERTGTFLLAPYLVRATRSAGSPWCPTGPQGWVLPMPEPLPEPLPRRKVLQGLLYALAGLMIAGSPIVFLLGLEFLPRHGDGMGVIGAAALLAVADVVLAVVVLVALVCTQE